MVEDGQGGVCSGGGTKQANGSGRGRPGGGERVFAWVLYPGGGERLFAGDLGISRPGGGDSERKEARLWVDEGDGVSVSEEHAESFQELLLTFRWVSS
mmetsp:Transcript_44773/g.83647  ORF Transcript_44773/g.83647 Transcript_44773/m.83647 type:complete len:98 (+) Transcript_44773:674-967(+)